MKIGILGGGQLGKMLYHPATKLNLPVHFMDNIEIGPVANITKDYILGDIQSYEDVLRFGSDKNILSIEIEKVNTDALSTLQENGVKIYPQPHIISCIQDKGQQKEFYAQHRIPSASFKVYDHLDELKSDLEKGVWQYPFVQKMRKDGYDGRGVQVIRTARDLHKAFSSNFLVESMVDIDLEIGVVTCQNKIGDLVLYDPSEMVFHPEANILLYQLSPARISKEVEQKAKEVAKRVTQAFGIVGLLAIEMFITGDGQILVNEVAPRPHNSGHHTIEATLCSQYENHLRALVNYPLGAVNTLVPTLLMNILGQEGYEGPVHYEGLEMVLALPGANVHLYGKTTTKPFRKMGHITLLGRKYEHLIEQYEYIQRNFRVISK